MKGCFILDIEGGEIEIVHSIAEAIQECKDSIKWLENKEGVKYPIALADWHYKLKQLEQIERDGEGTEIK